MRTEQIFHEHFKSERAGSVYKSTACVSSGTGFTGTGLTAAMADRV